MNVMIWGGTRGLGRELARLSLEHGHTTTVTGRRAPEDLEEGLNFTKADFSTWPPKPEEDDWGLTFGLRNIEADILFWVAGHWLRKPLAECSPEEILRLYNVHLVAPTDMLSTMLALRSRLREPRPLHLVTIASSSAWKVRGDGQVAYGAVQAAKVQLARNLHAEAPTLINHTTIVRPGGMKTEFFDGTDLDTSTFMDPAQVAAQIWKFVEGRRPSPIIELDIRPDALDSNKIAVDCFDRDGDPWSFEALNAR